MSNLTIEVWDATGNQKQLVESPAYPPVNRVIAILVEKLNLPRYSPDGQLISYKFHHKASGRQLLDDQTWLRPTSTAATSSACYRKSPAPGEHPWQPPATDEEMKNCPYCGERILLTVRKCRYCYEYLDPALREASDEPGAVERLILPVGRPVSAIAAGYLGLFSLLPFLGIISVIVSLVALRTLKHNPYLHGRGRAWFGLVMGTIMTLIYLIPIMMILIGQYDIANGRVPRF